LHSFVDGGSSLLFFFMHMRNIWKSGTGAQI